MDLKDPKRMESLFFLNPIQSNKIYEGKRKCELNFFFVINKADTKIES